MAQYDTAVPGVYVGVTFSTASQYPMAITAASGWSGGQLIAPDGTYPMRAVLRIIARNDKKLWKRNIKNNVQYLFRTDEVYITSIILYAVSTPYVNAIHTQQAELDLTTTTSHKWA